MLANARTFSLVGVEAEPVAAEVDIHTGLPTFSVVGLPDAAVRESRERIRAAIVNSGFDFPLRRITANLAPADLRKAGPGFDLAIASALLVASAQLEPELLRDWSLAGELALDGSIRPVRGVLAMAERAGGEGRRGIAVPAGNAGEAALIDGIEVAPLSTLGELRGLGRGEVPPLPVVDGPRSPAARAPDLADLRGQPALRRALEIAAAGGHSMLIQGPPGAGKSLAARRLPSIMPPLGPDEAIEVTRIASAAGRPPPAGRLASRPYRAPHHTISAAGLVGGGSPPRPGEITLAHHGVLFLDELPEFSRASLEALRQPLESGSIGIARARWSRTFPARFQLVAAANGCPCGHGPGSERCTCTAAQAQAYATRLSGALADRIDIRITVGQPDASALAGDSGEASAPVADRVAEARERAERRNGPGRCNAGAADAVGGVAGLEPEAATALERAHATMGLSGRGWERTLRVARTSADLRGEERVGAASVAEALMLRGPEVRS